MKQITALGLGVQFDSDQITSGSVEEQVAQAIDLINLTLQREPYGLAAQIFVGSTRPKITTGKVGES